MTNQAEEMKTDQEVLEELKASVQNTQSITTILVQRGFDVTVHRTVTQKFPDSPWIITAKKELS